VYVIVIICRACDAVSQVNRHKNVCDYRLLDISDNLPQKFIGTTPIFFVTNRDMIPLAPLTTYRTKAHQRNRRRLWSSMIGVVVLGLIIGVYGLGSEVLDLVKIINVIIGDLSLSYNTT